MHYFIRVNGESSHNNPDEPEFYVKGEPPVHPDREFDYLSRCLKDSFVRIGWPDTGDLRSKPKTGALAQGYSIADVCKHVREYLLTFVRIQPGSVVMVPDKARSGDVYLAEVTEPYEYVHAPPSHPYECAHRLGVSWDRDAAGKPICYLATAFGISNRGALWRRGFAVLEDWQEGRLAIPLIRKVRAESSHDSPKYGE
jgi:hypothetical protein